MICDLPTVKGLVDHYAKLQGLVAAGWRFAVNIVAGLTHNGQPAWAVVVSDPATKVARVSVRDLDKTPLPCADPWHELKVTISHELWHPWVTQLLAAPTVENEEALVEAAAQAVVRSAGPDARIMARSILAIPAAVRARVAKVSASAGQRARGEAMAMNIDTVKKLLDAIEAGDSAGMAEVCKQLVAEAASATDAGSPPPVEPDGDEMDAPIEAREEPPMDDKTKPGVPPVAARPVARAEDPQARRARLALDSLNRSATRARLHELRVVDGVTLAPELEKLILAETDIEQAEKLFRVAALARGDGTPARARSGATGARTPPPAVAGKPKYSEADLLKEGFNPILASQIAAETDDAVADLTVRAARARLATVAGSWPKAPTGGAS